MRRPILLLTAAVLLGIATIGGVWASYKKPWVMDDFNAGYMAAHEGNLDKMNKRGCALTMAEKYDVEPSYVQYDTPDDAAAFYLGCVRSLAGLSDDWWNASGYLDA
jgi:hypothetical protein